MCLLLTMLLLRLSIFQCLLITLLFLIFSGFLVRYFRHLRFSSNRESAIGLTSFGTILTPLLEDQIVNELSSSLGTVFVDHLVISSGCRVLILDILIVWALLFDHFFQNRNGRVICTLFKLIVIRRFLSWIKAC